MDPAVTEFTLTSETDEEITVNISSDFNWIQPSTKTVLVAPMTETNFNVAVSCDAPGSSSGHFSLTNSNDAQESGLVPVQRICTVPPIVPEFLTSIDSIEVAVGQSAYSTLIWRLNSIWDGHDPIDYTVSTNVAITANPPAGTVRVNEVNHTLFEYECTDEGDFTFQILMGFDANLVSWDVSCKSAEPGIRSEAPLVELSADAGTERMFVLTLLNEGKATVNTDYTLQTDTPWLTLLQTSGSMPSASKDYVVASVNCEAPGSFIGNITVTSGQDTVPSTAKIPVILDCGIPPIDIVLIDFNDQARVGVSRPATSTLNWSIQTSWWPQEQVNYRIDGYDGVTIRNASGTLRRNQEINSILNFVCPSMAEDHEFKFSIHVGDTVKSFSWFVSCIDPPSGAIAEPESIFASLDMARAISTTTAVTLTNIYGENNLISISASDAFIVAGMHSVSLQPYASQSLAITLTCLQPGRVTGYIRLRSALASDVYDELLVTLECTSPAFSVRFNQLPAPGVAETNEVASSTLIWYLQSHWANAQAVTYSFVLPEGVTITDDSGTLVPNSSFSTHSLTYTCVTSGTQILQLVLRAGGESHNFQWQVKCIESDALTGLTLEFFQGPLTARAELNPADSHWQVASKQSITDGLLAGRDTIAEITVDHTTSFSESVQLSLVGEEKVSQNWISGETYQTGDTWQTRSTFFIAGPDIHNAQVIELEIPFYLPSDRRSRLTRSLTDLWMVTEPPGIEVRFIPFMDEETSSALPIDQYATEMRDYLPLNQLTTKLLDNQDIPSNVTDAEDLATYLITLWEEDGSNPLTFYHGLISGDTISPDLCGLAEVAGHVAVSNTGSECSQSATTTHELGHNFSLEHAPCGLEGAVADSKFPYADGSIGEEYGYFTSNRNKVESDHDIYDIMSYCSPTFISQHYFAQAASHLKDLLAPSEASTQTLSAQSETHGTQSGKSQMLILAGTLDPAGNWRIKFITQTEATGRVSADDSDLPYSLTLLAADTSEVLAKQPFDARRMSHTDKLLWSVVLENPGIADSVLRISDRHGQSLYGYDLEPSMLKLNSTSGPVSVE